jgi:hypothetical protein
MKIECSGPNGETFEAEFEHIDHGNKDSGWVELQDKTNRERVGAAQKALETWCQMIAASADKAQDGKGEK